MRVLIAIVAVVLVALTACESTESDAKPEDDRPAKASRCVDVPAPTLEAIASENFKPLKGAAVKSNDFKQVYMVAIRFEIDGDEFDGVWATPDLDSPGPIMSVDNVAAASSNWPQGTADNPLSIIDDGAREARDCLG